MVRKNDRENVYFNARKEAAKYNDRFSSRELTAGELNVSPSTLRDYETGNVKVLSVGLINTMAEVYNAPELKTWYCKNECPIGASFPLATEQKSIEGITLRLIREFSPEKLKKMQYALIDITEDGKITDDEKPELKKILENLDKLAEVISEMKLAGEKILEG